jgi:5'-3' exonuclease
MTVLLVDSDFLCYRNTASCQYTIYTLEEEGNEYATFIKGKKATDEFIKKNPTYAVTGSEEVLESWEQCKSSIDSTISHILGACDSHPNTDIFYFVSGKDNFRHTLTSTYKHKRKDLPKPHWHDKAHQYLIDSYGAKESHGRESDDMMHEGVLFCKKHGLDYILVHQDKDINQLAGKHYDPVKDKHYIVTNKDAIKFLYEQILTGDTVDCIEGISGIGTAKASKLLSVCNSAKECLDICVRAYMKAYPDDGEERMKLCAQLVYLRGHSDDSIFKRKEWLERYT